MPGDDAERRGEIGLRAMFSKPEGDPFFAFPEDGSIEVHITAEKPEGVPEENWLPISRKDEAMDVVLRIYAPDLEKFKSWKPPKAEKVK